MHAVVWSMLANVHFFLISLDSRIRKETGVARSLILTRALSWGKDRLKSGSVCYRLFSGPFFSFWSGDELVSCYNLRATSVSGNGSALSLEYKTTSKIKLVQHLRPAWQARKGEGKGDKLSPFCAPFRAPFRACICSTYSTLRHTCRE